MANFNFNRVILGGRICNDTELKTTPSGNTVCTFNVAVNRQSKEKETDFIAVVAWNKTAELASKYFHKGSSVCVEGRLQTRTWEDKEGRKVKVTEVIADTIYFVDSKDENKAEAKVTPNFVEVADDDELPF